MTDREMMNWLEKHPQCEVGTDDDEDKPRVIHRVVGSPNDREWRLIGRGATLREAVAEAMQHFV